MKLLNTISAIFFSLWLGISIVLYLVPFTKFPKKDIGEGFLTDWMSSFNGRRRTDTDEANEQRNRNNIKGFFFLLGYSILTFLIIK